MYNLRICLSGYWGNAVDESIGNQFICPPIETVWNIWGDWLLLSSKDYCMHFYEINRSTKNTSHITCNFMLCYPD